VIPGVSRPLFGPEAHGDLATGTVEPSPPAGPDESIAGVDQLWRIRDRVER